MKIYPYEKCSCGNDMFIQFIGEKCYKCSDCGKRFYKKYDKKKDEFYMETLEEE